MNFADYSIEAARFSQIDDSDLSMYLNMGLLGEAGEVCNVVKKVIRDHDGRWSDELRAQVIDEVGDVLWYLAMICRDRNITPHLSSISPEDGDVSGLALLVPIASVALVVRLRSDSDVVSVAASIMSMFMACSSLLERIGSSLTIALEANIQKLSKRYAVN